MIRLCFGSEKSLNIEVLNFYNDYTNQRPDCSDRQNIVSNNLMINVVISYALNYDIELKSDIADIINCRQQNIGRNCSRTTVQLFCLFALFEVLYLNDRYILMSY